MNDEMAATAENRRMPAFCRRRPRSDENQSAFLAITMHMTAEPTKKTILRYKWYHNSSIAASMKELRMSIVKKHAQ